MVERAEPPTSHSTLRQQRVLARALLLLGLVVAAAGLLTFHAPTCTAPSAGAPATCSPWETSQWLMIGGVFLAVGSLLYLALLAQRGGRSGA